MSTQMGFTPRVIREENRGVLLRLIEAVGPVSRAQLARLTNLSGPSVSATVDDLLVRGLVREVGSGQSTGGRRPTMVEYNSALGYIVGVDLGGTNLKLAVTDMSARIMCRLEVPTQANREADGAMLSLMEAIPRVIKDVGASWDKVIAIGVGAPGVADLDRGEVSVAPAMGWNKMPLARRLMDAFGVPAYVENDVNAMAIGELVYGAGRLYKNFVFVAIGTGIGAGIVINGELYRGRDNASGEVGYIIVDSSWERGWQGEFGCWESLASAQGIVNLAKRRLSEAREKSELSDVPLDALTAETVCAAARQGDPLAKGVMAEVARHLANGLASMTVILNPEAVLIGGGVARAGSALFDPVVERVKVLVPYVPRILPSEFGDDAGIVGAAAIAIQQVKQRLLRQA